MTLSANEVIIANQSLSKIGSLTMDSGQTSVESVKANMLYAQTRDSLLRSYDWNFAIEQADLAVLNTLTIDVAPTVAWAVGDTLVGMTSLATATILTVNSTTEFVVSYTDGAFVAGEAIKTGVSTDYEVTYGGVLVTYEGEQVYSFSSDSVFVSIAEYPPLFDYDHQYSLPNNFLRLTRNYQGHHDWTVQRNRLLSRENSAQIEYIKQETDPTMFDPLFTEVLILQLAIKLVNPVAGTSTTQLKAELNQELKEALRKAVSVMRQDKEIGGRSRWNNARYTSGLIRTGTK